MNTGFMRESVCTHNSLIGSNGDAGNGGEQPAGGVKLFKAKIRIYMVKVLPDVQRYGEFLKSGIPSPLADSVDGALNLANAGFDSRERVGYR